jgi:hypothetical protein
MHLLVVRQAKGEGMISAICGSSQTEKTPHRPGAVGDPRFLPVDHESIPYSDGRRELLLVTSPEFR